MVSAGGGNHDGQYFIATVCPENELNLPESLVYIKILIIRHQLDTLSSL